MFLECVDSNEGEPGCVVILPTASGIPDESGPGTAEAFQEVATRHTFDVVRLVEDDPNRADDPEVAKRSEDSLLNGVYEEGVNEAGVEIKTGMGLFPYGLIDQHFLERGRMGRLIVAIETTDTLFGFGVEEDAAVIVTLGIGNPILNAIGPDSVLIIDRREVVRHDAQEANEDETAARQNLRLTLLGTGDRWNLKQHHAIENDEKLDRALMNLPSLEAAAPAPNSIDLDPDDMKPTEALTAWESDAIPAAIHALAADPRTPQELESEHFVLTFSADEQSQFHIQPDDRRDLCAVNVRLDITRRPER